MSIVRNKILLEPLEGRLWRLEDEVEYRWDGVTYLIPKGFVFDGASIPSWARWVVPKNGVKLYAALLHDYLYRYNLVERKKADTAFLKVLLEMGEAEWSAYGMYYAVRIFGSFSY